MAEEGMIEPEEGKRADRVLSFGNVPTVDLQQIEARPEAIALIPEAVALQYNVLPLYVEEDTLTVVADYPDDLQLMDTLSRLTNKKIKMVSPLRGNLRDTVSSYYAMGLDDEIEESIMDIITPMKDTATTEAEEVAELAQAAADAPIVKAVDKILTQAVKERASDVHIAPEE
jgi:type IV pilus assembly protein PilB